MDLGPRVTAEPFSHRDGIAIEVTFQRRDELPSELLDPDEARTLAAALLTAADAVEQKRAAR